MVNADRSAATLGSVLLDLVSPGSRHLTSLLQAKRPAAEPVEPVGGAPCAPSKDLWATRFSASSTGPAGSTGGVRSEWPRRMAQDRRSRPGASRSIPLNRASTASVFELPPRWGTVCGAKRRSSCVRLGRLLGSGFRLAERPSLELDPVGVVDEAG